MAKPPFVIDDMRAALAARLHPAITRWNRLEGRPRTHDFDRALRAEVRDALWMLSRQWQLGEFVGDDAGSPVLARACLDIAPITAYRPDDGVARAMTDDRFERRVERRPLRPRGGTQPLSLDLRLAVGRRWLKLLAASAAPPAGSRPTTARPTAPTRARAGPDAPRTRHRRAPGGLAAGGRRGRRAMDGIALLDYSPTRQRPVRRRRRAAGDEPKLAALADGCGPGSPR